MEEILTKNRKKFEPYKIASDGSIDSFDLIETNEDMIDFKRQLRKLIKKGYEVELFAKVDVGYRLAVFKKYKYPFGLYGFAVKIPYLYLGNFEDKQIKRLHDKLLSLQTQFVKRLML